MKKIVFCLSFLLFIGTIQAQRGSIGDMLFPKYTKGIATLKDGSQAEGLYNYSTIQRQMQYMENGLEMKFKNPAEVASIAIGDRIFENVNNQFWERVSIGGGYYYINWGAKWVSVGKNLAMGATSHSTSSSNYKNTDTGTSNYALFNQSEGMTTIPECFYYIRKGDDFKRFNSAASLAKAIGCCSKELKEFVKREKIDFKNPDDVQRMMMTFFENYSANAK
jgi:hypothetical protein